MLACRPGRHVSYEFLADQLDTSKLNLMKTTSKLRADLEACGDGLGDILVAGSDGYRLDTGRISVDASELTEAVEDIEEIVRRDPAAAVVLADQALSRWGEPFHGVPSTEATDSEGVRLQSIHRRIELARAAALVAAGRVAAAETALRPLVADDPDDETACHHLVVALGMLGRQSEALDAIRALNERRAERGTEPSAALRAIEDRLVRGELGLTPQPLLGARREPVAMRRPVRFRLNTTCRFVGARRRLGLLDALARRVRKAGSAVCYLEGLAGIGKTRLVEEWLSSSDTADFRQCWIEFRSADSGPFRRVVQLLADTVGIPLEDTEIDLVDEVHDERLIRSLLHHSVGRPTMVVVEDLHWAAPRCLDFFERLIGALNRQNPDEGASILLVVTCRPVDEGTTVGTRLERMRRGRVVSWLTVEPLSELEVHELVRGLGVPRPSPSLVRAVEAVSAGNPLAIRTLVARLERTRALLTADGMTVIDGGLDGLPPVADVESLVGQHLDTFDQGCRQVLVAVAVLGDHAKLDLVDALIGQAAQVSAALDEAVGDGVLVQRGDLVHFDHPATAQVALNAAQTTELRRLHRAAADWLMDHGDDPATVLWIADHLTRAADEADPRHLVRFGTEAGELAMEVASWSDADRFLTAALDGAEELNWPANLLAELRLKVAGAAFRDHQITRAAHLFTEVAEFGEQTRDHRLWGTGLVEAGRSLIHDATSLDSSTLAMKLRAFLLDAEVAPGVPLPLRAGAEQQLATLAWGTGDFGASLDHAERALELAAAGDDPLATGQAALLAGLAEQGMLRLERSLASFARSSTETAGVDTSSFRDWGPTRSAVSLWALGRLDEARIDASTAAGAADEAANWAEACAARMVLAGVESAAGVIDRAVTEADAAHLLYHRSAYYWMGAMLLAIRVGLAVDRGDDAGLAEIVADWKRPLPLNVEVVRAIHAEDRSALVSCANRLRRRRADVPSFSSLPALAVGADLAVALQDRALAAWCLDRYRSPAMAEVVLAPGPNRLILRAAARCRLVLGEVDEAAGLLTEAIELADRLGLGREGRRSREDLAGLSGPG